MKELQTLSDLVSIRSDKETKSILDYIESRLKKDVKEIVRIRNGDKENMIIGVNSELNNINPIVLSGHIDTVIADENKYCTNPYSLVIKDDYAYGLGVIDMKCFTSTVIDNISYIKEKKYPIIIAITGDEETTFEGVNLVIDEMKKRNIIPKFTIVGEPTDMDICNESNGCYEYVIEFFGKACHSSQLDKGVNAIQIMSKMITFIENQNKKNKDLTSNCGVCSGGTIVNKVPDYAKLNIDIRTSNKASYLKFMKELDDKIKFLLVEYPDSDIKINKKLEIPLFQNCNNDFINIVKDKFNLNIKKLSGGCEAGYYLSLGGSGMIFGAGGLQQAHKPNEFLKISDYKKYNKMFIDILDMLENY